MSDSLPDQPDGIDDQSRDLPDPLRAAARVNAFLSAYGDGLIEVLVMEHLAGTMPPLYARDLQALTNTVNRELNVYH